VIDLHTHSTASDGSLTPTELVDLAAEKGLQAIALTDHDTVAGIGEALRRGQTVGVRVIPGIELGARQDDYREMHILGYFIRHNHRPLLERLEWLRARRFERGQQMVARLSGLGIAVAFERVEELARGGAIGRPHVALALVEAGYVETVAEAFRRYLTPGQPAYVEKQRLSPREAIELIQTADGIPVLAHPATLGLEQEKLEGLISELCEWGLRGIEAYWSRHNAEQIEFCKRLAAQFDLAVTGGSDFHGAAKPGIELGKCGVNGDMPFELLYDLQTKRRLPMRHT